MKSINEKMKEPGWTEYCHKQLEKALINSWFYHWDSLAMNRCDSEEIEEKKLTFEISKKDWKRIEKLGKFKYIKETNELKSNERFIEDTPQSNRESIENLTKRIINLESYAMADSQLIDKMIDGIDKLNNELKYFKNILR